MTKTELAGRITITIMIAVIIVLVLYYIGTIINPRECNVNIPTGMGGSSTQICDRGDVIFEYFSILFIGFISSLFILMGLFLIWALFYFSWHLSKYLNNFGMKK